MYNTKTKIGGYSMTTFEITVQERNALVQLTKPSSYKRLYSKLDDIEKMDSLIDDYFSKSNYSKVSDIYIKKGIIKQNIMRNQLALLRLYQCVIIAKANENNKINLQIQESLIPLLIETLTYSLIRINVKKEKNKTTNEDKMLEQCCDALLDNISKNIKSYKIYKIKKDLKSKKNIIDFNEFHKN